MNTTTSNMLKTLPLPKRDAASVQMTDSLRHALEEKDVDHNVIESLQSAMYAVTSKMERSAYVYANAMERSMREFGIAGVKHQVMYLLLYMGSWRGDEARMHKKVLREWSESDTPDSVNDQ